MKKIFTLLFAAAATLAASAADYQLLRDGAAVADGASFEVGYVVDNSLGIPYYKWDSGLQLSADPAVEITVEVTSENPNVSFCGGFTSECITVGATGAVKTGHTTSTDPINLAIDFEQMASSSLTAGDKIYVKVYPTENPTEATDVTVILVEKPASEVGSVGIVAADGAKARYYDMLGRTVDRSALASGHVYIRIQGGKATKVYIK